MLAKMRDNYEAIRQNGLANKEEEDLKNDLSIFNFSKKQLVQFSQYTGLLDVPHSWTDTALHPSSRLIIHKNNSKSAKIILSYKTDAEIMQ